MKERIKKYFISSHKNDFNPYIFRGLSVPVLSGFFVLLLLFSISVTLVVNKTSLFSAIYPAVLVDLTNEARVEKNYQPLKINEKLVLAAQLKANDMVKGEYFAHTSPEGLSPWYWIGLSGYQFIHAGENLAIDFYFSKDVNSAWLDSAGHAANIFSSNFTEVGIATSEGIYQGRETIFVVQMFGTPVSQIPASVSGVQATQEDNIVIDPSGEQDVSVVTETVINDDELFIVVQDTGVDLETLIQTKQEGGLVQQAEAPGYERYSSWYDWVILRPTRLIEYALYVAVGIIMLTLLLSIFVSNSVRHSKSLLYGVFVLIILLIVIYLNRMGIITKFLSINFFSNLS